MNIKTIKTTTLEMAYLEKGQGPLLLCLHGFPDHAYTFTSQIDYFSALGFRVVAPFMRGYAPTQAPKGSYQTAQLGLDVLAFIEALDIDTDKEGVCLLGTIGAPPPLTRLPF